MVNVTIYSIHGSYGVYNCHNSPTIIDISRIFKLGHGVYKPTYSWGGTPT